MTHRNAAIAQAEVPSQCVNDPNAHGSTPLKSTSSSTPESKVVSIWSSRPFASVYCTDLA